MLNHPFIVALFALLLSHINKHGKCIDVMLCKELAEWIHASKCKSYGELLDAFIEEYGVPEDLSYMGRDEYGEKQYHSHNPDTNWRTMIGRELGKLGHYNQSEEAMAALVCVYEMAGAGG